VFAPCGPLPQMIAALRGHARVRPAHHVFSHRIRHAVHVGSHARAVVASGCRVVANLVPGVILGVLPPASAFHRPMAPPMVIQHQLAADPAIEESGRAPDFSPSVSATDAPSDAWPTASPPGSFMITFAPAVAEPAGPPSNGLHYDMTPGNIFPALPPGLGWSGPDGAGPGTSVPHAGGPTPDGPPELTNSNTAAPVPEPSSALILGSGLCGVIMLSFRRRGVASTEIQGRSLH
jgi:PEP-CTERM motif